MHWDAAITLLHNAESRHCCLYKLQNYQRAIESVNPESQPAMQKSLQRKQSISVVMLLKRKVLMKKKKKTCQISSTQQNCCTNCGVGKLQDDNCSWTNLYNNTYPPVRKHSLELYFTKFMTVKIAKLTHQSSKTELCEALQGSNPAT